MANFISEDDIEQALLEKLNRELGFELLNCYTKDPGLFHSKYFQNAIETILAFSYRLCHIIKPGLSI